MADLYRDFVFTRNTVAITSSDTQITCEDVSLFPSNGVLAKGEYFVCFESTLTYPHSFEIVRLTSINVSTKTLNVIRGQAGTIATSHAIVTYIKGTLTSDMVRRALLPAPEGAFYLFPRIEGLADSFGFCKSLLLEHKVGLAPGVAFGAGGEGSVRICYAAERAILEPALERLTKVLTQYQK